MEDAMKALTIHQPYAWAIIAGLKRVENRTWSTEHRGPLLIHAGHRSERWIRHIELLRDQGVDVPDADELVYGAILGQVELLDVVPLSPLSQEQARPERQLRFDNLPEEDQYGLAEDPWATGPVCWILREPRPFSKPIPCRGQPGLWDYEVKNPSRRG